MITAAVTADLDRLGTKATGSVIHATLPTEADAMHTGQTRHQKEIAAAAAGLTMVEANMAT